MILSDIVYNDSFDATINYRVYNGIWNDGGTLLFKGEINSWKRPTDAILDKQVVYMTIDIENNDLILEIE